MRCGECGKEAKLIHGSVYECENSSCRVIRFSFIAEMSAGWQAQSKKEVGDAFHQFRMTDEDVKLGQMVCLSCGRPLPISQKKARSR